MENYKLLTMSEIETKEVRFLTKPYLPCGRISLIIGDPGEGKTTLSLAIAAAVTRGEEVGGSGVYAPPTAVIYQTAEDGCAERYAAKKEDKPEPPAKTAEQIAAEEAAPSASDTSRKD